MLLFQIHLLVCAHLMSVTAERQEKYSTGLRQERENLDQLELVNREEEAEVYKRRSWCTSFYIIIYINLSPHGNKS